MELYKFPDTGKLSETFGGLKLLCFHLLICTWGQVVIFYAITGSERYDLLKVLSINLQFLSFGKTTISGILPNFLE